MCHTDGCGRMQLGFTSLDVDSSAAPKSGQANWYGRSPCDRMQGGSQAARSERPSDDIQAYVATHGPPSRFSSASRRGVDIPPCAGNDAKVSLPISTAQARAYRRSRLAILRYLGAPHQGRTAAGHGSSVRASRAKWPETTRGKRSNCPPIASVRSRHASRDKPAQRT